MKITVKGIDSALKKLKRDLNDKKKEQLLPAANRLVADLEEATPKDTGYAASRWEARKVGDKVVVSNDAPYIDDLNRGHSQQAPAYFIEKTVLENKDVIPNGVIVDYR